MTDENAGNGAAPSKKADVQIVKMSDGREVGFAGKRKMLKDDIYENGKVGVRLDFRNGETRTFWIPDSSTPDGVPLRDKFAGHGSKQKYGDETAGLDDIDDMILAVDELDGQIQSGNFTAERTGSGIGGTSVLLRALVEFSGKTVEQVKEFLKGKNQTEKLALRGASAKNKDGVSVKDIVARIEAEKSAKAANVDTGALLAQL